MDSIKSLFEKLKNNKLILIILIIGVAFLFIPAEKEEKASYDGSYEKELSEKTEEILGKIEGAGRVKVMLSFYDKGTGIPVTDKTENRESVNEKTVSASGKVVLLKEMYPSVRGAVVVCDGGESERVKNDISEAVAALTGAPFHNIKIFKMEG
ncbi:MAG: hypothetical protein IJD97_03265 [Clostridia bacterium]|nr:hypothetical protein [Clostridia bacterium]